MVNQATRKSTTAKLCQCILQGENASEIASLIDSPDFDVNIKTNAGYSPIYYAVMTGNLDLVKKLSDKGANLLEEYDGLTLRDIAKQKIEITKNIYMLKEHEKHYRKIANFLADKNVSSNEKKLAEFVKEITANEFNSQSWIKKPLGATGYEHKSEGYCNGVAHMGVQALLLEERDKHGDLIHLDNFKKRVQMLSYLSKSDVLWKIDYAKHKRILLLELAKSEYDRLNLGLDNKAKQAWLEKKVNDKLFPDEKDYLEIQPFLDGVEAYQQIHKHNELLEKKESAQTVIPVMPIVSTSALEKEGGMVIVDHFSGVYSDQELLDLLVALRKQVEQSGYKSPVALQLSANRHAITIGFDPEKNEWIFIDANKSHAIGDRMSNNQTIVNAVRNALFAYSSEDKLLIQANIFSTVTQCKDLKEKVINPLRKTETWKRIQTVTQDKMNFKDKENSTWKDTARANGDKDICEDMARFEEKTKSFFSRHKKALLVAGAILLGSALVVAGAFTFGAVPIVVGAMLGAGVATIGLGATVRATDYYFNKKDKNRDENIAKQKEDLLNSALQENEKRSKQKPVSLQSTSTHLCLDTFQIASPQPINNFILSLEERLKSYDFYHGAMDSKEAQNLLNNKPDGTCFIRYSDTAKDYYVCIKSGDSMVQQCLTSSVLIGIEQRIEEGELKTFTKADRENEIKSALKSSAPPSNDTVSFESHELYHGTMKRDEAVAVLQNESDGACLIRFSDNEKKYCLSIKSGNKVEHISLEMPDIKNIVMNGFDKFKEDVNRVDLNPLPKSDRAKISAK